MVQRIEVEEHEIIKAHGGQTLRLVESGPPGPPGMPGADGGNYVPPLEILGMLSPTTMDAVITAHALEAGVPEEFVPYVIEGIHQVDLSSVTSMDDVIANVSNYLAHTSVGMMMVSKSIANLYEELGSLNDSLGNIDGKANSALAHANSTGNPHNTTAAEVGASPENHDHTGTYSPVNHNHDGTYSPVNHNHDGEYEEVGVAQSLIDQLSRPNGSVFYSTANQSEMLSLVNAKPGDFAFRADQNNSLWGLVGPNPTTLADWTRVRDGDGTNSPIYPNMIQGKAELIVGSANGAVTRLGQPSSELQTLVYDSTQPSGLRWDQGMAKLGKLSGEYYGHPSTSGQGAAMNYAGCFRALPMWLPSGTLDRIAVVSTVAAVSTWRLGIYKAGLDGYPYSQTPFLDAGTVNMNATTGIQAIAINQAIKSGFYWLCVLVDSYTAQPTYHVTSYVQQGGQQLHGSPINVSSVGRSQVGLWYNLPMSPGALPTFPTSSVSWSGAVPSILVRYV